MSQNNPTTIVYAGIDVAKASFQLDWAGHSHALSNDAKGHARLLRLLGPAPGKQVVMEATAGYEQPIVRALRAHGFCVSVVLPQRVRQFAGATGQQAKTDRIDAALIRRFAEAVAPAVTPELSAEQMRLSALVRRRLQLVKLLTSERNHAEHEADPWLRRQGASLRRTLERQIQQCEKAIAKLILEVPDMRRRCERLQQVPGVGAMTAATLQAFLPELGQLQGNAAAALAGVAPFNHDSGPRSGARSIRGGRPAVRRALYMAALTAARHDPVLKAFYSRLRLAGKKPLVALTAVMRKLVLLLNRMLKNPHFVLLASKPQPSSPAS